MKILLLLLCLLIVIPADYSQQTVGNRGRSGPELEIVKLQDELIGAYLKRDVASIDRILAKDYNYIDSDGVMMDKRQILAEFKSGTIKLFLTSDRTTKCEFTATSL